MVGFLHFQSTSGVSDDGFRFRQKQFTVPHFEMLGRIAEQAKSVNVYNLSRESQQHASASKPHWANQRCRPSTAIRYGVGCLLKGGMMRCNPYLDAANRVLTP
jgi:hypothetical protein